MFNCLRQFSNRDSTITFTGKASNQTLTNSINILVVALYYMISKCSLHKHIHVLYLLLVLHVFVHLLIYLPWKSLVENS